MNRINCNFGLFWFNLIFFNWLNCVIECWKYFHSRFTVIFSFMRRKTWRWGKKNDYFGGFVGNNYNPFVFNKNINSLCCLEYISSSWLWLWDWWCRWWCGHSVACFTLFANFFLWNCPFGLPVSFCFVFFLFFGEMWMCYSVWLKLQWLPNNCERVYLF